MSKINSERAAQARLDAKIDQNREQTARRSAARASRAREQWLQSRAMSVSPAATRRFS